MSDPKAKELGLEPRARIVTAATFGNEPEYMGVAPIGAIKKVLDRAGMKIGDVGAVELNEAFAAQVIPIMDECDIPLEKLNTHGGAIALGHPFGMIGARIMTTLLNAMETDDHQIGLETMCVAGGQGKAMIVERLQLPPPSLPPPRPGAGRGARRPTARRQAGGGGEGEQDVERVARHQAAAGLDDRRRTGCTAWRSRPSPGSGPAARRRGPSSGS